MTKETENSSTVRGVVSRAIKPPSGGFDLDRIICEARDSGLYHEVVVLTDGTILTITTSFNGTPHTPVRYENGGNPHLNFWTLVEFLHHKALTLIDQSRGLDPSGKQQLAEMMMRATRSGFDHIRAHSQNPYLCLYGHTGYTPKDISENLGLGGGPQSIETNHIHAIDTNINPSDVVEIPDPQDELASKIGNKISQNLLRFAGNHVADYVRRNLSAYENIKIGLNLEPVKLDEYQFIPYGITFIPDKPLDLSEAYELLLNIYPILADMYDQARVIHARVWGYESPEFESSVELPQALAAKIEQFCHQILPTRQQLATLDPSTENKRSKRLRQIYNWYDKKSSAYSSLNIMPLHPSTINLLTQESFGLAFSAALPTTWSFILDQKTHKVQSVVITPCLASTVGGFELSTNLVVKRYHGG